MVSGLPVWYIWVFFFDPLAPPSEVGACCSGCFVSLAPYQAFGRITRGVIFNGIVPGSRAASSFHVMTQRIFNTCSFVGLIPSGRALNAWARTKFFTSLSLALFLFSVQVLFPNLNVLFLHLFHKETSQVSRPLFALPSLEFGELNRNFNRNPLREHKTALFQIRVPQKFFPLSS